MSSCYFGNQISTTSGGSTGIRPASRSTRSHLQGNALGALGAGLGQVMRRLQIEPELRCRAEIPAEAQRGVRRHRAGRVLADDGGDAGGWYMQLAGQGMGAEPERTHELLAEHFTRMGADASVGHGARSFPSVIVDDLHVLGTSLGPAKA